jgi:hypothetical protein
MGTESKKYPSGYFNHITWNELRKSSDRSESTARVERLEQCDRHSAALELGDSDGSHRNPSERAALQCDRLRSEARQQIQPAEFGVCIRTLGVAKAATYERRYGGASSVFEILTSETSRVELV